MSDACRRASSGGSKSRAPASTTEVSGSGRWPGTDAAVCHAPPVSTVTPIPSK